MKFEYYNWVPILIPFISGLMRFKSLDKGMTCLFYFVCYGVFNEAIGRILFFVLGIKNTMPLSNAYLLISFLFLSLFYFFILKDFLKRNVLLFFIIGFEILYLINIIFIQSIFEYPVVFGAVMNILILAFSIIYFYKIMVEANIVNLWKESFVWINAGILIYYSGSLFYTILFKLILEYSREFSKLTTAYFSVLNALFYVLIAIGFWKIKQKKNKSML